MLAFNEAGEIQLVLSAGNLKCAGLCLLGAACAQQFWSKVSVSDLFWKFVFLVVKKGWNGLLVLLRLMWYTTLKPYGRAAPPETGFIKWNEASWYRDPETLEMYKVIPLYAKMINGEPTVTKYQLKPVEVGGSREKAGSKVPESALFGSPEIEKRAVLPKELVAAHVSTGNHDEWRFVGMGWREADMFMTAGHVVTSLMNEGRQIAFTKFMTDNRKYVVPAHFTPYLMNDNFVPNTGEDLGAIRLSPSDWAVLGVRATNDVGYSRVAQAKIEVYGLNRDNEACAGSGHLLPATHEHTMHGLVPHSASTMRGFSGSPVFAKTTAGTRIVGVHVSGRKDYNENLMVNAFDLHRFRRALGLVPMPKCKLECVPGARSEASQGVYPGDRANQENRWAEDEDISEMQERLRNVTRMTNMVGADGPLPFNDAVNAIWTSKSMKKAWKKFAAGPRWHADELASSSQAEATTDGPVTRADPPTDVSDITMARLWLTGHIKQVAAGAMPAEHADFARRWACKSLGLKYDSDVTPEQAGRARQAVQLVGSGVMRVNPGVAAHYLMSSNRMDDQTARSVLLAFIKTENTSTFDEMVRPMAPPVPPPNLPAPGDSPFVSDTGLEPIGEPETALSLHDEASGSEGAGSERVGVPALEYLARIGPPPGRRQARCLRWGGQGKSEGLLLSAFEVLAQKEELDARTRMEAVRASSRPPTEKQIQRWNARSRIAYLLDPPVAPRPSSLPNPNFYVPNQPMPDVALTAPATVQADIVAPEPAAPAAAPAEEPSVAVLAAQAEANYEEPDVAQVVAEPLASVPQGDSDSTSVGGSTCTDIVLFYGHSEGKLFREFSNFYSQDKPTRFVFPSFLIAHLESEGLDQSSEYVACVEFSEKAIMLCKAMLMKDKDTYDLICKASTPQEAKALGRQVRNFDPQVWDKHVRDVAFAAVYQKFAKDEALKALLLGTGTKLIAEASPDDAIWGIGLAADSPLASSPALWPGKNILGEALMRARAALQEHPVQDHTDDAKALHDEVVKPIGIRSVKAAIAAVGLGIGAYLGTSETSAAGFLGLAEIPTKKECVEFEPAMLNCTAKDLRALQQVNYMDMWKHKAYTRFRQYCAAAGAEAVTVEESLRSKDGIKTLAKKIACNIPYHGKARKQQELPDTYVQSLANIDTGGEDFTRWVAPPNGPAHMKRSLEVQLQKIKGTGWPEETVNQLKAEEGPMFDRFLDEVAKYPKNEFNAFENINLAVARFVDSLDSDKSSGWSSHWIPGPKGQWQTQQGLEDISYLARCRLCLRIAVGPRWMSQMTPAQLVSFGLADPRVLFIKDEPHSPEKAAEGRWRLIWGASLVDVAVASLSCRRQDKLDIAMYQQGPKTYGEKDLLSHQQGVGCGHHDEGIRRIGQELDRLISTGLEVFDADASGWDMSVRREAIYCDAARRFMLYRGKEPELFKKMCLCEAAANSAHVVAMGHDLWEICVPGITASGILSTSAQNSFMRALTYRFAGVHDVFVAGDDAVGAREAGRDHVQALAAYGPVEKLVNLYDPATGIDFTSHTFRKTAEGWHARFNNLSKACAKLALAKEVKREQLAGILFAIRNSPTDVELFKQIAVANDWPIHGVQAAYQPF